jgi:hypothetical protein
MKIEVGIYGLKDRPTLRETDKSVFTAMGRHAQLLYDGETIFPCRLGPKAHWKRSLHHLTLLADRSDADAVLLFEDDIRASVGLGEWLDRELCRFTAGEVGVISLYTASSIKKHPGWNVMPRIERPHAVPLGACALLFPVGSAKAFLKEDPDLHRNTGQGGSLLKWCQKTGREWWFHSPSFVQHVGVESTLGLPINADRQAGDFVEEIDLSGNPL